MVIPGLHHNQKHPSQQNSQPHRRTHAQPHNTPRHPSDLSIRDHFRRIPNQMTRTIEAMERERQCDSELRCNLQHHWPRSEARCDRFNGWMPDHINGSEGVEGSAESDTRDTIEAGEDHVYTPAVGCEVWCDRPIEALAGEGRDCLRPCRDLVTW